MRDLKRRKEELQAALIEAKDQATIAYEERLNTVGGTWSVVSGDQGHGHMLPQPPSHAGLPSDR